MKNYLKIVISILIVISLVGGIYLFKSDFFQNKETEDMMATKIIEDDQEIYTYKNQFTDITLKDRAGKTLKLSDFKGKVIVTTFWASWCPYCRDEMAVINEVYQKYKNDERVAFVMVNMVGTLEGRTHSEEENAGNEFLDNNKYEQPNYIDETLQSYKDYDLMYIPTTVIYGTDSLPLVLRKTPRGKDIYISSGEVLSRETLENYIESALAGKKDASEYAQAQTK